MFEKLLTCKIEDIYRHAEQIAKELEKENVELFIRTL